MSTSVTHHSRDLTRGPLLSSLLWFSLPILIGNLFQQLYNIVDTAAVSHLLGADALAALGCTGSLYSVVLCIATGMTAPVKEKYDRLIESGLVPLGRWGQPDDIAKAVVALCDGTFGYTTGQSFILDGGMHIRKL